MPSRTRALLWITALVALSHAAVLLGLPSLVTESSAGAAMELAQPVVMQTRMVQTKAEAPAPTPTPTVKPPMPAPAGKPAVAPALKSPPKKTPKPVAPVEAAPEPDSFSPPPEPQMPPVSEAAPENTAREPSVEQEPQTFTGPAKQEASPAASTEPETEAASAQPEDATALAPQVTLADGTQLPPGTALPVKIPQPIQLEFDAKGQVKGFEYSAGAQLLWRHDGARYELTQSLSMFLMGTRAQTSTGDLTEHGLQPQRFDDKGRKPQSATFDVAAGIAHFSGGTPDAKIALGVQDRVSVFLQLASLIAAAPERYAPGSIISLTTSSARHASRWSFKVVGVEDLRLPVGSVQALRLEKLPSAHSDMLASLWLATDYNYLPVRIRLNQGSDDYVDLRLKSHSSP